MSNLKARQLKQGSKGGVRFLVLLLLLVLSACSTGKNALSTIPARPDDLGREPIEFDIPSVETWSLANGLTVYYYQDEDVPLVRGKLYLPGGSLTEPWGIAGLAQATGDQMREGSIPGLTPDQLDKKLDSLAASIESGFGGEYGTASFFSLAEDLDEVFGMFSKVVREPQFAPSRLALWKKLAGEGIRRRRDDPSTMAGMSFSMLLYGKDSPFSREITFDSLEKITPERMREFHRLFVRPDGAKLAITGAISKERAQALVEQYLGDWQPGAAARPALPNVDHQVKPGIYVLERDFDQATILIGHRGPPRHTDDQYDMAIYNRVFGHGGFGSMLFREIRSRLGLAYSVYGGLWPGPVEGVFQIDLATRATEAWNAVRESIALARQSGKELPPEKDFVDAKDSVERSFVFKFASPGYLVERAVILDLLGYPADYDEKYLERVEAVSRDGVREVAQRWVKPEDFVIVAVGKLSPAKVKELFPELPVYPLTFDTTPAVGAPL